MAGNDGDPGLTVRSACSSWSFSSPSASVRPDDDEVRKGFEFGYEGVQRGDLMSVHRECACVVQGPPLCEALGVSVVAATIFVEIDTGWLYYSPHELRTVCWHKCQQRRYRLLC